MTEVQATTPSRVAPLRCPNALPSSVGRCRAIAPTAATICKRLKARVALDTAGLQREALQLSERFVGNLGGAMFVLLPSFALWLKLVYFNRRLRYTEHLVFALHVHAFWFLMLGLALADLPWLTPIVLLAVPVYTWLAMAAVYGGRRFARLLRAGVVSLLYGLSLAFAAAGVGVWSLLF